MPKREWESASMVGYGPYRNAPRWASVGPAVRLRGSVLSADGAGAHEFLTPSDTPTAASAKDLLTPAYARPKPVRIPVAAYPPSFPPRPLARVRW